MRYSVATLTDGIALVAIALALAFGGRALLAQLHVFASATLVLLGAAIVLTSFSLRTLLRTPGADRLAVTVRIAYLTGFAFTLWAVAAPARWNSGSSIAMLEVAVVFDLFTRFARSR